MSALAVSTATSNTSHQFLTRKVEFAQGKVDPHEAGKAGGQTSGTGTGNSGGDNYKPTGTFGKSICIPISTDGKLQKMMA